MFKVKTEEERKKSKMKERGKQRIWDPAWEPKEDADLGNSNLIVNWMNKKSERL